LHGFPVAAGTALVYNGVANQFYSTKLPFREDCLSHETYPEPVELPLGCGSTVAQLFDAARSRLDGPLRLVLDRELVVTVDCPRCGWRVEVMRPRVKVKSTEAVCPNCREPGRPEFVSFVDDGSPLADLPLSRVGIPAYDIVRVDGSVDSGFFLLASDRGDRNPGEGSSR
jgi:adenylyltransferase/sulfurtransferase